MKKRSLSQLKQLKFESVKKESMETVKGGDYPQITRERYWTHYDCPDFEFD